MENYGYASVVGAREAPYLRTLGQECGLATDYHAVSHPSLPNYLALTSGTTSGITDDGEPGVHPLAAASIFSELGSNWRALEESMPTACDRVTSGDYAARHNPAVYFTNLRTLCPTHDLPLRYPLTLSAAFTFITPNICDDMHDCSVGVGSAWLSRIIPLIVGSSEYRSNSTVVFIVWDESDTGPDNQVAAYVIAPSVPHALRIKDLLTHYSLLRTTEQILGLRLLRAANGARSMITSAHL